MIRGLWTHGGVLYGVDGADFFSLDSAGLRINIDTLNSIAGNIDFASNLTQLCINDGSYLHVYTPATGTFTTSPNYPGGDRISFLDQRINFQFRGTQMFGWTALGDATSIDALSFASAETSPDVLVTQLVANREIWLMGTDSTEIWDPVGGTEVYRRTSAAIDYGCAAPFAAQQTANAVVWLSRAKNGQAMVLSATGHQARRISDRALEDQLAALTNVSNAKAFAYAEGGLSFYVLNVPGLASTWVWEETFGQWTERVECRLGRDEQWRATSHAFAYGKHYFGDEDGNIYVSDPDVHLFGDDPIKRQRIAPVMSNPKHSRVTYNLLEIIGEQGTGAQIAMRYSDDNGRTWSDWDYASVGDLGKYSERATFRRLGAAFDRVFEVVFTHNAAWNPVGVVWQ